MLCIDVHCASNDVFIFSVQLISRPSTLSVLTGHVSTCTVYVHNYVHNHSNLLQTYRVYSVFINLF